jgi:lysozyme family protein
MERNFQRSLSHVLKHEGGYVDHPKDPGGATNKGITIGTFRRYVDRNGTKDDLKRITDDQVASVYKKQYWDKVCGDDLPDGLDYAVFDFAVNSGPSRAAKYLQNIVGVIQDGKIGKQTLLAVTASKKSATVLIEELCADRLAFMKRIKDKSGRLLWPTFGKGWARRVNAVEDDAVSWATQKPIAAPKPEPATSRPAIQKTTPAKPKSTGKGGLAAILALAVAGAIALYATGGEIIANILKSIGVGP